MTLRWSRTQRLRSSAYRACGAGRSSRVARFAVAAGALALSFAASGAEGWRPSTDPTYRDQVIASVATFDTNGDDRAERTARHAYLAFDGGPDSEAAQDLQGFPAVMRLLWMFELRTEAHPVQLCTNALLQSGGTEGVTVIAQRMADSPEMPNLISLAERHAGDDYWQILPRVTVPGDAGRVIAAVMAIGQIVAANGDPELATKLAYYLAVGSDGACPVSERFKQMVESTPPP
jgi:hypothetical protein